jgi:hypothetical protein
MADSNLDFGDDDGFVVVKMCGAEARLDVWETNSKVFSFHEKSKALPDDQYNEGLVSLIEELGLPRVSHRMAQRFVERIAGLAGELRKKG